MAMQVDLVRARITEGESYIVNSDNNVITIKIVSVVDVDNTRTIKYVVEDSSDHDLVPVGTVYTLNKLDKFDIKLELKAEYVKASVSREDLTRLEYEKQLYNYLVSLLLRSDKALDANLVITSLQEQGYYTKYPFQTAKKKINRICNSGKYGSAITSRGGWLSLDKSKLAKSVRQPTVISGKRQVSLKVVTQCIETLLKEFGFEVVD
jgi:hypothetical protein